MRAGRHPFGDGHVALVRSPVTALRDRASVFRSGFSGSVCVGGPRATATRQRRRRRRAHVWTRDERRRVTVVLRGRREPGPAPAVSPARGLSDRRGASMVTAGDPPISAGRHSTRVTWLHLCRCPVWGRWGRPPPDTETAASRGGTDRVGDCACHAQFC